MIIKKSKITKNRNINYPNNNNNKKSIQKKTNMTTRTRNRSSYIRYTFLLLSINQTQKLTLHNIFNFVEKINNNFKQKWLKFLPKSTQYWGESESKVQTHTNNRLIERIAELPAGFFLLLQIRPSLFSFWFCFLVFAHFLSPFFLFFFFSQSFDLSL